MYNWRKMSKKVRKETIAYRKQHNLPWHNPPHLDFEGEYIYLITAACFEHKPIIGINQNRMLECEEMILDVCFELKCELYAWCVLPNHYHLLLKTSQIKELRKQLGRFHGKSSRKWNLEDKMIGRQIWFNCFERPMKTERHFYVSLNYVHHNPVFHGYVEQWAVWEFSSGKRFLDHVGREKATELWKAYPLLDYGKKWDI